MSPIGERGGVESLDTQGHLASMVIPTGKAVPLWTHGGGIT